MNKNSIDFSPQKCTCVPSGMCHPQTQYLLGCPHPHYYNEKGLWKCGVDPATDYHHPTQAFSHFGTTSDLPTCQTQSSSYFGKTSCKITIDMNPWGEYVIR